MAKTKNTIWDNIYLPILEDPASIQVAIHQITSAYLCSRLDARHTGLLLYALQIASQNIDRKTFHSDSEIVRSMTVTDEGDEQAPEKEICEPSDCASCNRRDTCDDYYPDEDEEEDDDSDEEDCDSDEDESDSDEEDEEPAAPSPVPPGIQRFQRAILARMPELKALRPSGDHPNSGTRHAAQKPKSDDALQVVGTEGGGGFNPRIKPAKLTWASAPEEHFQPVSNEILSFSAASLAPEGCPSLIPPEKPNSDPTSWESPKLIIANGEPLPPPRSAIRTG